MIGLIIVFFAHNIVLFWLWNKSKRSQGQSIRSRDYRFLFFVYLLLSILGLQMGDYIAYSELVSDAYNTLKVSPSMEGDVTHMGRLYDLLAYWLGGHYLLWRFVVFGASFVFIFITARKICFDTWPFFFMFSLISMSGFFVGRMYWGVALFFCSVIAAKKTGNLWYLLFSLLAVFSHKCLYVLPLFIPFYFIKLNKKSLLILACFFVVAAMALRYVFEDLKIIDLYVEGMSRSISSYTDDNVTSTSVFGRSIGELIIYLPQFVAVVLVLILTFLRGSFRRIVLPDYIQTMVLMSVALLLFAFAIVLGGFGDGTLSYRYIAISYFPSTFVLYYVKESRLISYGLYSFFFAMMLFSFEASLLVPVYYAVVG